LQAELVEQRRDRGSEVLTAPQVVGKRVGVAVVRQVGGEHVVRAAQRAPELSYMYAVCPRRADTRLVPRPTAPFEVVDLPVVHDDEAAAPIGRYVMTGNEIVR
jgi:hypothetical protein